MSFDELLEVQITLPTATPKSKKMAPAVATVITSQDIARMGAKSLDEVLETVPGLHITPSLVDGMGSIKSFRGIQTSVTPQTLMLMDGQPIANIYTSSRRHFQLPVKAISRIEVVRGPGSAVYGADAFSGIINIITKEAKEIDGTAAGGLAGSFDTYGGFAQHGNSYGPLDFLLSFEYQQSRGDQGRIIDADLQSKIDKVRGTHASLAPGPLDTSYKVYNGHLGLGYQDLKFRGWVWFVDKGLADGGTNTLSEGSRAEFSQYLAELNYDNTSLHQDLELAGRLAFQYLLNAPKYVLFPKGAVLPIGADGNINFAAPVGLTAFPDGVRGEPVGKDRHTTLEVSGIYKGFHEQRWRTALGYRYQRVEAEEDKNFGPGILNGSQASQDGTLTSVTNTPYIMAEDKVRDLWYISLQDEWSFAKDWELTAGVRYDQYSDVGDTTNPRLALVWALTADLAVKALYGTAFRPPSLGELYAKNNPSTTGNPNLKPETIKTYELVFDYTPVKRVNLVLSTQHLTSGNKLDCLQRLNPIELLDIFL